MMTVMTTLANRHLAVFGFGVLAVVFWPSLAFPILAQGRSGQLLYDGPRRYGYSVDRQFGTRSNFGQLSLIQDSSGTDAPAASASQPTPESSAASDTATSAPRRRTRRISLASGNKMHTDSLTAGMFTFWNKHLLIDGTVGFPVQGRVKIAENNSAIPQDRVYFLYKHFHNAFGATIDDGSGTMLGDRAFSVNRYNAGIEKTFLDGLWSVELRMPLIGTVDSFFDEGFSSTSGGIGNLSVIAKRLVYESETSAVSAGLGISLPTGEAANVTLGDEIFSIGNQVPHLLPYVGFLGAPSEQFFWQGFFQVDVPAGGNQVSLRDTSVGGPRTDLGGVVSQALVYVDAGCGYWLYQSPQARWVTGVVPVLELHYTTAVNAADQLTGNSACTEYKTGDPSNQFDVLNLTFGIHTQGPSTTFYTGCVFPLRGSENRFFDAEVQCSLNYRF